MQEEVAQSPYFPPVDVDLEHLCGVAPVKALYLDNSFKNKLDKNNAWQFKITS